MAVAARIDPKVYFAPQEWAPLSRRSRWKGLALLAHAWIVIGLAMAAAIAAPGWWKLLAIPLACPSDRAEVARACRPAQAK